MALERKIVPHPVINKLVDLVKKDTLSPRDMEDAKDLLSAREQIEELARKQAAEREALYRQLNAEKLRIRLSDDSVDVESLNLDLVVNTYNDDDILIQGTILIYAAQKGHLELVELLLAYGANPNTEVFWEEKFRRETFQRIANPLLGACVKNKKDILDKLLAIQELNPNLGRHRDSGGSLAAAISLGHLAIAHSLIADSRIDPNVTWTIYKIINFPLKRLHYSQNLIQLAIEKNQLSTVILLLGRNDLVLSEEQVNAVLKFLDAQSGSEISKVLTGLVAVSERLKKQSIEVKESKDAKEVKPLSIAKSVQGVSDFFKKISTKTHGVSELPTRQNILDVTPLPPVLASCVMQYLASDEFLKTQEAISELNQQGKKLGR